MYVIIAYKTSSSSKVSGLLGSLPLMCSTLTCLFDQSEPEQWMKSYWFVKQHSDLFISMRIALPYVPKTGTVYHCLTTIL